MHLFSCARCYKGNQIADKTEVCDVFTQVIEKKQILAIFFLNIVIKKSSNYFKGLSSDADSCYEHTLSQAEVWHF